MRNLAFILPVRNEGNTIFGILFDIYSHFPDSNIIVIVNDSRDNSYQECLRFKIKHPNIEVKVFDIKEKGKANAVNFGFKQVRSQQYILMDTDAQHHVNEVKNLIAKQKLTGSNLVIGSRFLIKPDFRNRIKLRYFYNVIINKIVNITLKTNHTDILSGFRLLNHDFIKNLEIKSKGFHLETELLFYQHQYGFSITEVAIKLNSRENKKAKTSSWLDGVQIILFLFSNLYQNSNYSKHPKQNLI